jgi:hypothetical protein
MERLSDSGFHFFVVLVRIKGFDTFPVRAFAKLCGETRPWVNFHLPYKVSHFTTYYEQATRMFRIVRIIPVILCAFDILTSFNERLDSTVADSSAVSYA